MVYCLSIPVSSSEHLTYFTIIESEGVVIDGEKIFVKAFEVSNSNDSKDWTFYSEGGIKKQVITIKSVQRPEFETIKLGMHACMHALTHFIMQTSMLSSISSWIMHLIMNSRRHYPFINSATIHLFLMYFFVYFFWRVGGGCLSVCSRFWGFFFYFKTL